MANQTWCSFLSALFVCENCIFSSVCHVFFYYWISCASLPFILRAWATFITSRKKMKMRKKYKWKKKVNKKNENERQLERSSWAPSRLYLSPADSTRCCHFNLIPPQRERERQPNAFCVHFQPNTGRLFTQRGFKSERIDRYVTWSFPSCWTGSMLPDRSLLTIPVAGAVPEDSAGAPASPSTTSAQPNDMIWIQS